MQSYPAGLSGHMAMQALEQHGVHGCVRARIGSRHMVDGAVVEVVRGRSDVARCLTCGAEGSVDDVAGHVVGGRAHVWCGVDGARLVVPE